MFSKAKQSRQRQVARSPASSARANARSSVRASGRAKNRKLESSGSSAPRASVQGGPLARVKNAVASERATKTKAINWQLWRQVMLRLGQAGLAIALAIFAVVATSEAADYFLSSPRYAVKHLRFTATEHVDEPRLVELLAIEPDANVFSLDLEQLRARVVADPWISEARVDRRLPDILEVVIEEHRAVAVLAADDLYLVNEDAQPFKRLGAQEPTNLPLITGIAAEDFSEDRTVATGMVAHAFEVLRAYESVSRPELAEIHLGNDGTVTVYTAKSATALELGRVAPEEAFARWDSLRAALGDNAGNLEVAYLDSTHQAADNRLRVVARFRDQPRILSQSQPAVESLGEEADGSL